MSTIRVDVVSAEASIFSGDAKFVALPGENGAVPALPAPEAALLQDEVRFQSQYRFSDLPRGAIHAAAAWKPANIVAASR